MRFVGRREELRILDELREKRSASLVVLRGRRRIGKSRLCEEFGSSFPKALYFSGVPPERGVTAQVQRNEFALRLEDRLGTRPEKSDDWSPLLWHLARSVRKGPTLVVLDELTWLGAKDPTFLGKLKNAWDLEFKKNPNLVLILSGSLSAWIERNVLSSTGFLGRVSLDLRLDELKLHECRQFWPKRLKIDAFEILKVLAVTGGVPRYLEEILPSQNAEQNMARMCFRREGLLFNEFARIFADLFQRRAAFYTEITQGLADGPKDAEQIRKTLQTTPGGRMSDSLDELVETGYLARDYTWRVGAARESKLSQYRLADNYVRFYLKYIAPNRERVLKGSYRGPPAWPTIFGLQIENLVLNSRESLHGALRLEPGEIVHANPFFQRPTKRQPGCQIDYLIETRHRTLLACELKFQKDPIGRTIIREMQDRLERLRIPRGFSVRPVLVHVNGVRDTVLEQEYFTHIVDLRTLLDLG